MKEQVWVIKGTLRNFDGSTRAIIVGVRKRETDAKMAGWDWTKYQNERMHLWGVKCHASYEVFPFELL